MKYILLDTNIYLDMLINRDNGTPYKTYEYLLRMLNYGDIKLLIPEVIKNEIFRNIEETIDIVPNRINSVVKQIDNLKWFNVEESSFNFDEFYEKLNKIKQELKEDADAILSNEGKIKRLFRRKIESLLKHSNTIFIEMNESILNGVMRRKILKKAPMHKKDDSYADASIIETILHIKELLPDLCENDQLYFISRNYKDFAVGKNKKDILHYDIKEEFEQNLDIQVIFSNLFFKTLKEDFRQEYIEAKEIEDEVSRIENEQIEILIERQEAAIDAEAEMQDALEEYYKH